jgi:hypothetical protein
MMQSLIVARKLAISRHVSHAPLEPNLFIFDEAVLKEQIASIRSAFPTLGPMGWMSSGEMFASVTNHRHPLRTKRFTEQVARAIAYIKQCTKALSAGEAQQPARMHAALAKRYTGSSVQIGALICAHLMLGGKASMHRPTGNALPFAMRLPLPRPRPVTVALRPTH